MFGDVRDSERWKSVERISKGWSSDRKYRVVTVDGRNLLLRVSGIEEYEKKKKEYDIVKKYSALGFPMSEPVDFGVCNGGKNVYMVLSWIEGRDLKEVLAGLPEYEQYRLGRKAGEILKKIHSIPVDDRDRPAGTKKARKLMQLSLYEESQVRIEDDAAAIEYVRNNIDCIWKEGPAYLHGDFHPGNLIFMPDGEIGVIDFNRWEVGDPYEEFDALESFGIEHSIPYCIGQIDAYFDSEIPDDFWMALAVYVAHTSLQFIKWAEKSGQEEIDKMKVRCRRAFENYDNFSRHIPRWYTDEYSKRFDL